MISVTASNVTTTGIYARLRLIYNPFARRIATISSIFTHYKHSADKKSLVY